MKMPPLLLGLTFLLWGWQIGLPWLGGLAALSLEAVHLFAWRGSLATADFRRLRLLYEFLRFGVLGAGLMFASRMDVGSAILRAASWLPIVALPFLLAQLWSGESHFEAGRLWRKAASGPGRRVDLVWPVWALTLLAASVQPGSATNPWFYAALCLLMAGALFACRARRISAWRWALTVLLALALGWLGHLGLSALQGEVEAHFGEWFLGMQSGGDSDPNRSETAIGRIGELKLSSGILLRVRTDKPLATPLLLRDAAYTTYLAPSWLAREPRFQTLAPEASGTSWRLADVAVAGATSLRLAYPLRGGKGLLVLPAGALRIEALPAGRLERSRLGAVSVSEGPSRLDYRVIYAPHGTGDEGAPTALDLQVPPSLASLFAGLAERLQLKGKPADDVLSIVRGHFRNNFRYSLVQGQGEGSALADFLLRTHSGHCEYFATATVLLLREAGIPARYATGYSVQEYSAWENAYLVRERHAHAWAQAYVKGEWHDLDTTPARWAELEARQPSVWQQLADLANWLFYRLADWRERADPGTLGTYFVWALLPCLLYGGWRLRRMRRRLPICRLAVAVPVVRPGLDSPWYAFEQGLAGSGLERLPWETPAAWAKRLAEMQPGIAACLPALIRLHYRYRFDPQGLTAAEQEQLRAGLAELAGRLSPTPARG